MEPKDQNYFPVELSKVQSLQINIAANKKFAEEAKKAHIKQQVNETLEHRYYVVTAKYSGSVFDVVRKPDSAYELSGNKLVSTDDSVTKDSYYKIGSIDPKAAKTLQVGDLVKLKYYGNDKQKPYIVSSSRQPSGQNASLDDTQPPVEPPVFAAGMWLQHGGFWWQPQHNREAIPRLDLIPPTQEIYTNEEMAVWFEESTGNTIIVFKHNISYGFPWSVKKNGDIFIDKPDGGFPPAGVPDCYIELTGFVITEAFDPSGGQLEPGSYSGMALQDINFSSATWTATYKGDIPDQTVGYFRPDEIPNAARKTLPFKGLVLFPDGAHQNVSVLTPHFEVAGQNIRVDEALDHITFVVEGDEGGVDFQREGQFFFVANEPVDLPVLSDYEIPDEFSYLIFNDLIMTLIEEVTYGLKILMGGGRWLHFYYTVRDFEDNLHDTQTVDGTTQILVVKPRESQYIGVIDSEIEIPTYDITSINEIKINGFSFPPDELATFNGDELTITTTLNDGDTVEYDLNGYSLFKTEQTFETENDQSDYEITNDISSGQSLHKIWFLAQGISGPDSGDEHEYTKLCYVLPGTDIVRLFMYWPAESEIRVSYHYNTPTGDYYKASEMRIYEIGGDFSGQRILKTPIPTYTLNPSTDPNNPTSTERRVDEELGLYRDGALFFEPNTKTYSIAGPEGPIWRSRALLTEPAPTLATPNIHYSFTPWTEEPESTDWYNTNPNYNDDNPAPEVKVKNRESPWYGFCCGGPYGLQGSWNRYGGVVGDSNQVLRLWKRNTKKYVWKNHKNIELNKLLPSDISTGGQVRIQGMGQTDYYDRTTYGFSIPRFMPGKWPISKNYEAWIVAAPFVVENFQADIDNAFARDPNDRGWKDAGITFNAIDPETGVILSQYTIRPSKDLDDVLPVFVDNEEDIHVLKDSNNASIAESIDKYYNHNPYYYGDNPSGELLEPYDGQNTVICSSIWATVPWDGGYIYRLYGRITGFADEIQRNLNYPGIPMFPATLRNGGGSFSFISSYDTSWLWSNYQGPDTNASLNKSGEPNISMDEDGNIYFVLNMPFWQRMQNVIVGSTGVGMNFVQRSFTQDFEGGEGTQSFTRVQVYFDGNLCDGHVEAYFNGNPTGHNYPGFDSGFLVPYQSENVYIAGTFSHYLEGTENPETGYPGVPIYEFPSGTIEVKWFQPTVDDFTEFWVPAGPFEYPSFLGYQTTPMPIRGMAISNEDAKHSPEYVTVSKPILFKLHFDRVTKTITEKWRKDLYQGVNFRDNLFNRFGEEFETLALSNVAETAVNHTIACGRYIFVVKANVYSNPTGTTYDDLATRKVVLEIYHNVDTEPELFRSIDIPNTEVNLSSGTHSVDYATADIDATGREHIFMKMANNRGTSVRMPLDEGDDPDVQNQLFHESAGEPDFPRVIYDARTMARAARSYYWMDNDNNVKRKTISEETEG